MTRGANWIKLYYSAGSSTSAQSTNKFIAFETVSNVLAKRPFTTVKRIQFHTMVLGR